MNQILYEDVQTNSKDMSKIIRFFAIAIIIFGVALIGGGVYGFLNQGNSTTVEDTTKPTIFVSTNEDTILIRVSHNKAIDRIIYSWNESEEIIILGDNRTNIEEDIEWPVGENELHIRVIDVNGIEATYKQTYLLNYGQDIEKPTLKFSEPVNNKITITATDETELWYITYRWNEEEEETIEDLDGSKTIITATIPIMEGENTLTVTAVDNNGNETIEEKIFKAYKKPVIKCRQVRQELQITITDENGLDYIEYSVNDEEEEFIELLSEEKEWTQTIQLQEGENKIVITAMNIKEISTTFKGKATYTP